MKCVQRLTTAAQWREWLAYKGDNPDSALTAMEFAWMKAYQRIWLNECGVGPMTEQHVEQLFKQVGDRANRYEPTKEEMVAYTAGLKEKIKPGTASKLQSKGNKGGQRQLLS